MEAKAATKGKEPRQRKPKPTHLKTWQDTKLRLRSSAATLTCVSGRLAVTFKAGRELRPGDSLDLTNCSDVKIQAIEAADYIVEGSK